MPALTSCCSSPEIAHALGSRLAFPTGPITAAHLGSGRRVRERADLLVLARIATGVPGAAAAEAMAISGGRIIGIGSADEVAGLVDPATRIVRPDGVVIPGLVEPHMHIWTSLLNLTWTDMSKDACPTFDDVVALVKQTAAQAGPGAFVLGKLFDPSRYPGEPVLTRALLDQVAPDNPVLVMNASMHYLYANSKAFEKAGITDQTPDPEGGSFGRADGRLDGVVGEAPAELMMVGAMPPPSQEETASGIRQILAACAARGVTSLREAATGTMAGTGEVAMLHALNGSQRLPVRVSTAQFALVPGKTFEQMSADWTAAGVTPFSGDEMVRADAWKVVTDGSNQGRSGYFLQPYLGEVDGGRANYTPEGLRAALKAGLDGGWQLMVHTNGDAAVEFALTALEELLPAYGEHGLRHRLEHCSVTTDDQLARMARAGLSPSFLMNHVYYWGAAFRDTILGPSRAERLDRVASAIAAGLRPSLHSDYNVTEVHPLLSARTAVLRTLEADGSVLNAAERVSPAQALAAITSDAAWQIHADDRGTLEVGKRADYAVVSDDPWTTDATTWADIAVHETYLDGEIAYSA
jgi:predicted amidohydrolase YtcJ